MADKKPNRISEDGLAPISPRISPGIAQAPTPRAPRPGMRPAPAHAALKGQP